MSPSDDVIVDVVNAISGSSAYSQATSELSHDEVRAVERVTRDFATVFAPFLNAMRELAADPEALRHAAERMSKSGGK